VRAHLACHVNSPIETEALFKVAGSLVQVVICRKRRETLLPHTTNRKAFRRPGVTFKFKVIHQETFTNGIFRTLVHGISDKISADAIRAYVSRGHSAIARAELLQSNPIQCVVTGAGSPLCPRTLRSHTNWHISSSS